MERWEQKNRGSKRLCLAGPFALHWSACPLASALPLHIRTELTPVPEVRWPLLIRVCHPSPREEDIGIITLVHHKPLGLLRRKERKLNFVAVLHFPSGISFFGYLFRILSAMPCSWIVVSCSSREGEWSQQGLMSPSWWHRSPGLLSLIHSFNVSLFLLPFLPLFLFWGISMCQAET